MPSTTPRLAITVSDATDDELRTRAAVLKTNVGLVVRGLIRHGLDHFDDADVQAALQEVIDAERSRRAAVGREVMTARHQREKAQRDQRPPEGGSAADPQ